MGRESMLHNINRTLRIVLIDGRELTGKLLVYDRHMNVVLGDATESREETKKMKEAGISPQRSLGLVLLRGVHVISVNVLGASENNGDGEGKTKGQPANFEKAPRAKVAGAKRKR
ncbi:putative Small nuclear ribonucleoprotein-associated protein B (snRNP-B) (Sm protein B) (Sm-B) (SmB) [Trypanosoma cruzi]|uniref:Sm protein B n=2 Tax=Trypanosoma cruzi TaxID=5693 RepID=Q4D159_TRYCC|nr:small nuclear ribonucleoprotein protein, putative [Trypanosoma cruzi]EAN86256.1 small nuclear ribonucleoprotein protein, putative [Trypanosoma cruzi]PWV03006.1 putative Small nuclear ribonucleoprotein-associated protein B (snRNP-B) (Sm protein B) (Sm-B) (SmB) [Trypanosoma cruzi]PWV05190.1 putative Small nuclear ribonucleoprotein-associated protein B (snRNP-B) (Sm protein B) (Sm-B) (SmB) [Trypanosoma cruzi]RNC33380.1 small nuclear ribonucleoprotein [Trypanosoma cruzi]RNC45576.1 small nuclear|eukprot:XP_808107.1 small nuclear ribonucleoprotein protein [Trypanosoma cruzi strain CL Brener]